MNASWRKGTFSGSYRNCEMRRMRAAPFRIESGTETKRQSSKRIRPASQGLVSASRIRRRRYAFKEETRIRASIARDTALARI